MFAVLLFSINLPSTFLFFAAESYLEMKQICIFLLNNLTLPPDKALAVYVQSNNSSPFVFCGAVNASRPSALLTLHWPEETSSSSDVPRITYPDATPSPAKIGVSVEDLATLPQVVDAGAQGRIEKLAMKVGENLFNFMQSFCGVDGNRLVVPMDILDRWFIKFRERAKRDPDYLKGFSL